MAQIECGCLAFPFWGQHLVVAVGPVKTNVPDAALLRKNEYKGCSFLSRLAPLLVARSWVESVVWRVSVLN